MPQFVVPASRDLDAFRSTLLELEASVSHLSADLLAIMSNRVSDLPGPTDNIPDLSPSARRLLTVDPTSILRSRVELLERTINLASRVASYRKTYTLLAEAPHPEMKILNQFSTHWKSDFSEKPYLDPDEFYAFLQHNPDVAERYNSWTVPAPSFFPFTRSNTPPPASPDSPPPLAPPPSGSLDPGIQEPQFAVQPAPDPAPPAAHAELSVHSENTHSSSSAGTRPAWNPATEWRRLQRNAANYFPLDSNSAESGASTSADSPTLPLTHPGAPRRTEAAKEIPDNSPPCVPTPEISTLPIIPFGRIDAHLSTTAGALDHPLPPDFTLFPSLPLTVQPLNSAPPVSDPVSSPVTNPENPVDTAADPDNEIYPLAPTDLFNKLGDSLDRLLARDSSPPPVDSS